MPHLAKATEVNGTRYRSRFEASVALDLHDRGAVFEYESETYFYESPRMYVPDFSLRNGIQVEVKGWLLEADRRKLLEVKRANPDLDLRLVFQRASARISKAPRALTYAQWAEKHGFPWAESRVPEEWLS